MFESCTRGSDGGAEAGGGRGVGGGPSVVANCYVRAAAAHVAKASAARTLAGAPIGWTSARGSRLCL